MHFANLVTFVLKIVVTGETFYLLPEGLIGERTTKLFLLDE